MLIDNVTGTVHTALSHEDGAVVAPLAANYGYELIGVVAPNTNWYSTVYDIGEYSHRVGVVAYKTSATLAQAGSEIDVEWARAPGGPWFPAPSSGTGDTMMALRVASGSDRTLLSRGQPMGRYWRVRVKAAGAGIPSDAELFLHYGAIY